jgi:uncharacterized membrane protein YraQ (UPF0718 family)
MELFLQFIDNVMILANSMSLFILLGLLIAGVLKELIPADFISSHLGRGKISSVIKATIFGIPMPVCSCSVIPLAKSLQKEGANKGAVQSFLIATPITGADSIMATYSFFGWVFTLYRVLTSVFMAIVAGILQNIVDEKEAVHAVPTKFGVQSTDTTGFSMTPSTSPQNLSGDTCCSSGCCSDDMPAKAKFSFSRVIRYAFVTLFGDIYFSLFIGILLGAAFSTLLPKELLAPLFEYKLLTYLAVLIIAMPMYVCATASLPIAAAFLLSGMSGGGAFVFLSAGPATNSVTMGVVAEMFGKRSLLIYLGVISTLSILFGYLYDRWFDDLSVVDISTHVEQFGVIDYLSSTVMFGLIGYYMLKRRG